MRNNDHPTGETPEAGESLLSSVFSVSLWFNRGY